MPLWFSVRKNDPTVNRSRDQIKKEKVAGSGASGMNGARWWSTLKQDNQQVTYESYNHLAVNELKEKLWELSLPVSGVNKALIERLLDNDDRICDAVKRF